MNSQFIITASIQAICSGFATGLAIYFANRFLEKAKIDDERKRWARVFISTVDIQCERIWWLQKRLDGDENFIHDSFSDLENAFSDEAFSKLFRQEGVRFKKNILKELNQYLEVLSEAITFLSGCKTRVKAPFYGDSESEKRERYSDFRPLIDSRMEAVIVQGRTLCERLYIDILHERKSAKKYAEARESVIPKIADKILDFEKSNKSNSENPYVYCLTRVSDAGISLLLFELKKRIFNKMTLLRLIRSN